MNKTMIAVLGLFLTASPVIAQHSHGAPSQTVAPRVTPLPVPAPPRPLTGQVPATDDLSTYMQGTGVVGADEALRHREHLGLSADQVRRLEEIRYEAASVAAPHLNRARDARQAAADVYRADAPDLKAYEVRLWEAGDHKLQAQLAAARVELQARSVLTPEQRQALARLAAAAGAVVIGTGEPNWPH